MTSARKIAIVRKSRPAANLWVRHFFPYDLPQAMNDRDNLKW
jgi:hypothetical protein